MILKLNINGCLKHWVTILAQKCYWVNINRSTRDELAVQSFSSRSFMAQQTDENRSSINPTLLHDCTTLLSQACWPSNLRPLTDAAARPVSPQELRPGPSSNSARPNTELTQLTAQPRGCMEMHDQAAETKWLHNPTRCHPWPLYDGTTQASASSKRSGDEDAGLSSQKKALSVTHWGFTTHKFWHLRVAPGWKKRFLHLCCCSLKDALLAERLWAWLICQRTNTSVFFENKRRDESWGGL